MKPHNYISIGFLTGMLTLGFAIQIYPEIDLAVSGQFYTQELGFSLALNPILNALHEFATTGARILGAALCALLLASLASNHIKHILNIPTKTWLFLLCMLLIGPGIIANTMLKDHWGRARPREVTAFGGSQPFTAPLTPQPDARSNGSFVAGDAAFGFYLPTFAILIPMPPKQNRPPQPKLQRSCCWSRTIFWAGMGMGFVLGYTRIAMGAHFLSDVIFAMLSMLATLAAMQLVFYGPKAVKHYWQCWLMLPDTSEELRAT